MTARADIVPDGYDQATEPQDVGCGGAVPPPLGTVRQIALVTRDLHASMTHFAGRLGIGPWFYEPRVSFVSCVYRGAPIETTIAAAVANSGPMQFELIQQNDDTPSIYREFLDHYPDHAQLQHLNIWVDDLDASAAVAVARGYDLVQDGRTTLGRMMYFCHADLPHIALELSDLLPGKAAIFARVREAADGWDGSAPLRRGFPCG